MKVEFGTTIPAGFAVEITTWENDADNYMTQQYMGLSERAKNFILAIAEIFRSNSTGNTEYGNQDADEDTIVAMVQVAQKHDAEDLLKQYFLFGYEVLDEMESGKFDIGDNMSGIYKLLGISDWYEGYFCRVYESSKVYYLDQDIVLPALKRVQ